MKIPVSALCALALPLASSAAIELGLTTGGIAVKSDAPACQFTVQWPRMTGGGERGAKVTALSDTQATIEYKGGSVFVVTLGADGTIRMSPKKRVAGDTGLSHNVPLPMTLKGASWTLDNKKGVFPMTKQGGPFFFKGDNKKLTVTDASGEGFTFAIPFGWAQLQDNRHWNNAQSFHYKTYSGLPEGDYVFTVTPVKDGKITLAKAPNLDPYAYVPYPEAQEALWPGKGPIRTFGWQDGIRRRYHARRVQDANAVFFIGDSLVEGWRTIEKDLAPLKIANRGVGGDTSRGCLFRFPLEVIAHQPAAVVIACGGNDLTAHGKPEHCLENVEAMIGMTRKHDRRVPVVVMNVPAMGNPKAPLQPGSHEKLNAGLKALAERGKCLFVDRYALSIDADGRQDLAQFAPDRIHYSKKGYEKLAKAVREVLTDKTLGGERYTPRKKLDLAGYEIVWRDEFDGGKVDATKWGSPRQQRQGASLWHERNVSLKDGKAVFAIKKTDDPTWRYESACLRTTKSYKPEDRLYEFRYGYVEARVRLHKWTRSDYWFALWMMAGNVFDNTDTRKGCEIDVMESFHMCNLGYMPHTFHWGGYGKLHNAQGFKSWPNIKLLDDGYHTYGCLWTPESMTFTIDGEITWTTDLKGLGTDKGGKVKSQGVPQVPAYIKLSVEAAPWAGCTSGWEKPMPEDDSVEVDWVRVWQKK